MAQGNSTSKQAKVKCKARSIWEDGGVRPKAKKKGLQWTTTSSKGKTAYKVINTFSGKSYERRDRAESVKLYNEMAAQMDKEGQNFELTPSERAALATWRSYREKRLFAGLPTMTLERAIQIAIEQEKLSDTASPLIADAVREYVNYLENQQRDTEHVMTTRRRLELSAGFFPNDTRMHSVGEAEAMNCLLFIREEASKRNGRPISANTFKQYATAMSAMWNWNVRRRRVAVNPFPAAYEDIGKGVKPDKTKPKKEYTTPASLEAMLNWTLESMPHMLPALAVIAFCGLRPTEAQRLKWEHITFDKERGSKVHIGETKTKTDYSRMVDLCPCAVAWIETAWQRIGKPSPFSHVIPARDDDDTEAGESARKCAWRALVDSIKTKCPPTLKPAPKADAETWPRDLLRHSYGTYYRAMTESLAKTADQMGNSEKICREHYSRPVLQAEGEAYFNIWPDSTRPH